MYLYIVKVTFKTADLAHFYTTPLDELKGKLPVQKDVIKQFKKKVQVLISVSSLEELKKFSSLNIEALKGDRKGSYSIRLNRQYRLIFELTNDESGDVVLEVILVKEISKHYEK